VRAVAVGTVVEFFHGAGHLRRHYTPSL
jgi:hypothetical protein